MSRPPNQRLQRTAWLNAQSWVRRLPSMTDSENYPLLTVGQLTRALGVPREFVFTRAVELGAICLRLPDSNGMFLEV